MNSRWAALVATSLVVFASLVITWQIRHYDDLPNAYSSISLSLLRGEQLAAISDISERDGLYNQANGIGRHLDLVLPKDTRVFMTDMTGPTNYAKLGYYYYITYFLFPREIGVSLDQPARQTETGFLGRTSRSDQEILSCGFDVKLDTSPGNLLESKVLKELPMREPVNPDWFDSCFDLVIAFLLPWLTALSGMWLFRYLFPALSMQMPLLEQLACSLGLGMMAVSALTLGVKLCGFDGHGLILFVTTLGSLAKIWRHYKVLWENIADGFRKVVKSPVAIIILVAGVLVFLILFRLAGLQGLLEFDAVMAWSLKAKILHLCTGNEIVRWFSEPRLTSAHLDYPTLLPSLHATTYDSLGHVNEFVTKFWPAWMLLFLLLALASLNRAGKSRSPAPSFALLGLLLLPATQKYVQMEGGTLPMIFFTVLGFVQCGLWLLEKDRARLGLGLTLLFGAAMTKFEGCIFLALVGSWMLLLPAARPSLKRSPGFWRALAFWFLAALPFLCLRVQIPSLHYESGWAGYALQHPGHTLANWPGLFLILIARLFVSSDFASWSGKSGQLHWIGKWDGLSSLYNHSTLGLAWFCLFMSVAFWSAIPARRPVIIWTTTMLVGALAAFSGVFASFVNITNLDQVMGYTADDIAGRYLLPVLLAWFATLMTLFFTVPPSTSTSDRSHPALKHGCWLAVVALLIMALGVFVLPEIKPAPPENPLPTASAANFLNSSETNSPDYPNPDLQTKMELAVQLDKAGKSAEAIRAYWEVIHLRPDDPIALNNLAWSLAANPRQELCNGREAVELASQAVELTGGQQPVFIGTLAAAYAEDGQFAIAVETANRARNLALSLNQPDVAAANEQLIKRYAAGKAVGLTNGP